MSLFLGGQPKLPEASEAVDSGGHLKFDWNP